MNRMEDWNALHKRYDANFELLYRASKTGDKAAHQKYLKIERALQAESKKMYDTLRGELRKEAIQCIKSAT